MTGEVGDDTSVLVSADDDILYPSSSFAANDPQPPSDNIFPCSDEMSVWNDYDFSQATINYARDILLEEDLDSIPCMHQDSLALQAAVKSFYDVLVESCPPNSSSNDQFVPPSPDNNSTRLSSFKSYNKSSSVANNLADLDWNNSDQVGELESFSEEFSQGHSLERTSLVPGLGRDTIKSYRKDEHCSWEERRTNKRYVISTEESEQLEILDMSFLIKVENEEAVPCPLFDVSRNEASKKLQHYKQLQVSSLHIRGPSSQKVNLLALLTDCAQAVGAGDQMTAKVLLQKIGQNSSPFGDGNQRTAHYFADGLETRMSGSGKSCFAAPQTSAAAILKAYRLYVSVSPFRKITNTLVNRTIARAAEKATRIHVIDFGISYGFQWPCFLNRLAVRPGGPPHVRITGIDLPQPGFRPAERVEETGRRLKRLADTLNVPFAYKAIAQRWENIRYEDLKIDQDEVTFVVCMNRLRNLPDDTIVLNSSRDAVLKLIKRINPKLFLHGILNGSFNAPFFVSRFREALFHFSALFDMFEATTAREDEERLVFEREMIGKDAINVIACEGLERVERPETYKQWQARNSRMGFSQILLPQDVVKRATKIKFEYHRDFLVDTDGDWVLLGWKGRIIHALSAWKGKILK